VAALRFLRRDARCSPGVAAIAVLLVAGCVSCGPGSGGSGASAIPSPPNCGEPTEGDTVVVLVSGTANEPGPSLTGRAQKILQDAADSGVADDRRNGKGSVAVVASADSGTGGRPAEVLPLTPRRANCEVEHGLQRDKLVKQNISRVEKAVQARAAVEPGLDLLAGIDYAVRGRNPGELIVVSNGMSTAGAFDLRQVHWDEAPADLVAQLTERGVLEDLLLRWHVLFTGLGATAGNLQPPLTKPARDTLEAYWSAICRAAAPGGSCTVDDSPLPPAPPRGTAEMPVIDVPGVSSASGPDGQVTTTLTDPVLGFGPDSAVLSSDAQELLRSVSGRIAEKIAGHAAATITVRGYVADPPDSTPAGRQQTSDERAAAVSDFLQAQLGHQGLSFHIDSAGAGTPPDPPTAMVSGVFDEATAAQMRKVTVTY
jgi:outer membrane protein OmpA-like peptidoglycan-associated protein